MYARGNPRTKKQLKEMVASGKPVQVFQPGPFADSATTSGRVFLEGPHYPAAHSWYASAVIKDSVIVQGSVK
jgi:hypothetical protein